jgi:predicted SAM-dependent methyltransferase
MLKLHLGCGERYIEGFYHVDLKPYAHVNKCASVADLGFIQSETVDLIYGSHVLEHFGRKEYMGVLREWFRVLKSGGVLRLSVPDFARCAAIYFNEGFKDGLTGLVGLIMGGQRDQQDFHRMIFDADILSRSLKDVGFSSVREWDWRSTEHAAVDDFSQAYLPHMDKINGTLMSLNLEGIK